MSDYMGDISSLQRYEGVGGVPKAKQEDKTSLDMTDFLTLMVTELTNQSIDQTADTSDMLNQMVQMQMITALTNMTDASIMTYAASLVGKEVTVGQYDADGNLQELVGVVSGTGTYGGEQVIFVGDKYYYLSEIMAIGLLPEQKEEGSVEGGEQVENGEAADGETDKGYEIVDGTNGTESGGEVSGEAEEEAGAGSETPEEALI